MAAITLTRPRPSRLSHAIRAARATHYLRRRIAGASRSSVAWAMARSFFGALSPRAERAVCAINNLFNAKAPLMQAVREVFGRRAGK